MIQERPDWQSGHDNPPRYFDAHQTSAAASVAAPSASAPPVVYVFPAEWQQKVVTVYDDDPLLIHQSYFSHKIMAYVAFIFCGGLCAVIAFILAGLSNSVQIQ